MPHYRVKFSPEWLKGRWGFTDRVLTLMGGRSTDDSHLEATWVVNFRGSPMALGKRLSNELDLDPIGRRSLTVFDIKQIPSPKGKSVKPNPEI